jgi:glycosyltransferase involved in cell wall biosynthesis
MTDPTTRNLKLPSGAVCADSNPTHEICGPCVLLLGPARSAVSGVSTHLNQLFESTLSARFRLIQFQVGSEGRAQGRVSTLFRLVTDPFAFTVCLIRCRPRIVHINTSLEPRSYWRDIVFLALAKAMRCKVVYQVHGGALPGEFFAGTRVLTALLRRILSWPDAVVLLARSEMTAYGSFAPRARLVRIANAVSADEADLRAERYSTNRPLRIVYLGRLAADKGIFETIEAVKILRDRGTAVSLTVAGSGPARRKIVQAIEADRLGDLACLLEPLFGSAKQHLWQEADVLAFPTYHREGLPYALLEAMAGGAVPVISPVGAIPDVVQDEVHGLFVPAHEPQAVANALERLANDRPLLHRLALAAHARVVGHYSVARMSQEFCALYASLAA